MAVELMAHFVAGYPGMEESRRIGLALAAGGADYLEMQFPFSDPSADGPVIQRACAQALAGGSGAGGGVFTLAGGWELLARLRAGLEAQGTPVPVFLMSYANPVFTVGVEAFVRRAAAEGAAGLIIPDLVPGADEGLYAAGRAAGIPVVPVAAPGLSRERRDCIAREKPEWIYAALRSGITGEETALAPRTAAYLEDLAASGARIAAGFGLRRRGQLNQLEPYIDCAVAGSYFVEAAEEGPEAVRRRAEALKGGGEEPRLERSFP